jgi:hypothetical protein
MMLPLAGSPSSSPENKLISSTSTNLAPTVHAVLFGSSIKFTPFEF